MFLIAFFRAIAATMLTVFFDALSIDFFESAIAAANDETILTFIFFLKKNAAVGVAAARSFYAFHEQRKTTITLSEYKARIFFCQE